MDSGDVILALNSGSSSLKLGCYVPATGHVEILVLTGSAEGIGREGGSLRLRDAAGTTLLEQQHLCESQEQALEKLITAMRAHLPSSPVAIGHRVVHGGPKLREHQPITPEVMQQLEAATHLAPLHIPQALRLIQQTTSLFAQTPQFACFDTTFHSTMPAVATHLPIPTRFFEAGVQRYGFHGLSCESVVRRLGSGVPARLIIAHLGNGSSVTAVRDGHSLDTSMGLSPTGGVPMGTRTGDLDPEVLLYLQRNGYVTADELEGFVNHNCGLAGISGGESDMQQLLQRSDQGDHAASLAIDMFCTAIRKAIGGYAALLRGVDLLVFTGGIGANSEAVRTRIVEGLDFLFPAPLPGCVHALQAQEEEEIALQCRRLLRHA